MTSAHYFSAFWTHCPPVLELAEALVAAAAEEAASQAASTSGSAGRAYPDHLPSHQVDAGLASGTLLQACDRHACVVSQSHSDFCCRRTQHLCFSILRR